MDKAESSVKAAGQEHLLQGLKDLSPDAATALLEQVNSINFDYVAKIFEASMAAPQTVQPAQPVTEVLTIDSRTEADNASWYQAGLDMIAQGKLAILLLAGGQGTRLGSSAPKGCYDIGLPSKKSLFQLQAERVLRLQTLAKGKPLRWYIMTSSATDAPTRQFFIDNNYFGLSSDQIMFFQQGMLPALTLEGKVILENAGKISMAPDGNGGVYMGLATSGVLADMKKHGVDALDCYCVDNALARLGDPIFAGFCASKGAQVGARVVARAGPEEKVGVFATRGGGLEVVEYSEMDPEEAQAIDASTGVLRYNWANICMHYFQREWLEGVADVLAQGGKYHIARKNIPSMGSTVPGIKLELFIFDTFPTAKTTALFEVDRQEEFAPVKNAPGSATDSPDTARAAVLALHKKWILAAGGSVEGDGAQGVEVSPLVSYNGEELDKLVQGRIFRDQNESVLQGN